MSEGHSRSITTNDAGTALQRDRDEIVMQAVVTAGALVAVADGRVDPLECDALVNFIEQQKLLPSIASLTIAEAFDVRVQQLQDRNGAGVIMGSLQPLSGLSLAATVIEAAKRVAAADQHIHPSESRALKLIQLIMATLPKKPPHMHSH